jgi:hypothetical protein
MLEVSKDKPQERIRYGLFGGKVQYYISGVDGTLAQLGGELPPAYLLDRIIENADIAHAKLMLRRERKLTKQ